MAAGELTPPEGAISARSVVAQRARPRGTLLMASVWAALLGPSCGKEAEATLEGWGAFCAAVERNAATCHRTEPEDPCVVGIACLAKAHRAEAAAPATKCLQTSCGQLGTDCLRQINVPDQSAASHDWEATCLARNRDCAGILDPGFGGTFCFDYPSVSDDYIDAHRHCLALDCGSILQCLYVHKDDPYCAAQ